jgi:hypothetical protein
MERLHPKLSSEKMDLDSDDEKSPAAVAAAGSEVHSRRFPARASRTRGKKADNESDSDFQMGSSDGDSDDDSDASQNSLDDGTESDDESSEGGDLADGVPGGEAAHTVAISQSLLDGDTTNSRFVRKRFARTCVHPASLTPLVPSPLELERADRQMEQGQMDAEAEAVLDLHSVHPASLLTEFDEQEMAETQWRQVQFEEAQSALQESAFGRLQDVHPACLGFLLDVDSGPGPIPVGDSLYTGDLFHPAVLTSLQAMYTHNMLKINSRRFRAEEVGPDNCTLVEQRMFTSVCPRCAFRLSYYENAEVVECVCCKTVTAVDPITGGLWGSSSNRTLPVPRKAERTLYERILSMDRKSFTSFANAIIPRGDEHQWTVAQLMGQQVDGKQFLHVTHDALKNSFKFSRAMRFTFYDILRMAHQSRPGHKHDAMPFDAVEQQEREDAQQGIPSEPEDEEPQEEPQEGGGESAAQADEQQQEEQQEEEGAGVMDVDEAEMDISSGHGDSDDEVSHGADEKPAAANGTTAAATGAEGDVKHTEPDTQPKASTKDPAVADKPAPADDKTEAKAPAAAADSGTAMDVDAADSS